MRNIPLLILFVIEFHFRALVNMYKTKKQLHINSRQKHIMDVVNRHIG